MSLPPAGSPSQAPTSDPRWVPGSVYAVFMVVWLFFLMAAVMGTAAAPAQDDRAAALLLAVLAYPVVVLVSTVASRRAVRLGRARAARVWNLLPMPWVVAGAAAVVWALS